MVLMNGNDTNKGFLHGGAADGRANTERGVGLSLQTEALEASDQQVCMMQAGISKLLAELLTSHWGSCGSFWSLSPVVLGVREDSSCVT